MIWERIWNVSHVILTLIIRSDRVVLSMLLFFFFQAEDGIRDLTVTGVQTCALPICTPVKEIATAEVVTVRPDEALLTVLERITEEGVDHVPVVEHDRLVGICTRTDLLRARSRYLEHERRQPGWRPQFRRVSRDGARKSA